MYLKNSSRPRLERSLTEASPCDFPGVNERGGAAAALPLSARGPRSMLFNLSGSKCAALESVYFLKSDPAEACAGIGVEDAVDEVEALAGLDEGVEAGAETGFGAALGSGFTISMLPLK